ILIPGDQLFAVPPVGDCGKAAARIGGRSWRGWRCVGKYRAIGRKEVTVPCIQTEFDAFARLHAGKTVAAERHRLFKSGIGIDDRFRPEPLNMAHGCGDPRIAGLAEEKMLWPD